MRCSFVSFAGSGGGPMLGGALATVALISATVEPRDRVWTKRSVLNAVPPYCWSSRPSR